mmetsp:Transcript_13723/g.43403  ORF Transcript_13723/g.43403 Transcript_13723/m.43403 type:complete len:89 (+) Transcript_13723:241-507(+)
MLCTSESSLAHHLSGKPRPSPKSRQRRSTVSSCGRARAGGDTQGSPSPSQLTADDRARGAGARCCGWGGVGGIVAADTLLLPHLTFPE